MTRVVEFVRRIPGALAREVDVSSLALFRVCFGFLMIWETAADISNGKYRELFEPQFHFTYLVGGVPVPDETGVIVLHSAIMALGLLVGLGALYRLACAALCLLLTAHFLMDATLYINHAYLYCWLAGLLAFMPAHRRLSVDAWLHERRAARTGTVPPPPVTRFWCIALLRFQMAVVYGFAGIAKLNPEWLRGIPLNVWLPAKVDVSPLGSLLQVSWVPLVVSWGGVAFDLCVVPLLLWRRTRWLGFAAACVFHASNAAIFGLVSFPWMSIAMSTLFFPPDWPRAACRWLARRGRAPLALDAFGATVVVPRAGPPLPCMALLLLAAYAGIQLALPLRHLLYPGRVSWTEEGHHFAWHMMLRDKYGHADFLIRDPATGTSWYARYKDAGYLTRRQMDRMTSHPDFLLQFAHFLASERERSGHPRPQVYVKTSIVFNGRKAQPLVDPKVDLAAQPRSLWPAPWIMPLRE